MVTDLATELWATPGNSLGGRASSLQRCSSPSSGRRVNSGARVLRRSGFSPWPDRPPFGCVFQKEVSEMSELPDDNDEIFGFVEDEDEAEDETIYGFVEDEDEDEDTEQQQQEDAP